VKPLFSPDLLKKKIQSYDLALDKEGLEALQAHPEEVYRINGKAMGDVEFYKFVAKTQQIEQLIQLTYNDENLFHFKMNKTIDRTEELFADLDEAGVAAGAFYEALRGRF
jgi:hypothetical protein